MSICFSIAPPHTEPHSGINRFIKSLPENNTTEKFEL